MNKETKRIRLTPLILNKGMSMNGGWSRKQLRCLGINRLKKGWKLKLLGKYFDEAAIEKFLKLRNAHLPDEWPEPDDALTTEFLHLTRGL